jgi:hypothetical protein
MAIEGSFLGGKNSRGLKLTALSYLIFHVKNGKAVFSLAHTLYGVMLN